MVIFINWVCLLLSPTFYAICNKFFVAVEGTWCTVGTCLNLPCAHMCSRVWWRQSLAASEFGGVRVWQRQSLVASEFGGVRVWRCQSLVASEFGGVRVVWQRQSLVASEFGGDRVWRHQSLVASEFGGVRVWWGQFVYMYKCCKTCQQKRTQKYCADFDSTAFFTEFKHLQCPASCSDRPILTFLSRVCILLNSSCQWIPSL